MTLQNTDTELPSLSPVGRDVLYLLGRGATAGQIAKVLGLPGAEVEALIALLQQRFGAADLRSLRVRLLMAQGRE